MSLSPFSFLPETLHYSFSVGLSHSLPNSLTLAFFFFQYLITITYPLLILTLKFILFYSFIFFILLSFLYLLFIRVFLFFFASFFLSSFTFLTPFLTQIFRLPSILLSDILLSVLILLTRPFSYTQQHTALNTSISFVKGIR